MNIRNKTKAITGITLISLLGVSLYFSEITLDPVDISVTDIRTDQTDTTKAQVLGHSSKAINSTQTKTSSETKDTRYLGTRDQAALVKVRHIGDYAQSSVYGELPAILKGTAIPNLYVDADGNLVVDKTIKNFIEYFLSAAREEGSELVVARMQEYFSMVLEDPAHMQAVALLDNYISYRQQLDSVVSRDQIVGDPSAQMDMLREALDRRKSLRRHTLGESAAKSIFSDSEKYEDYAVNMMKTQLDKSLSYEEQDALIQRHEESLPEHIKKKVKHERQAKNLERQVEKLKTEGGRETKIHQLRESFYGAQTADKWAFMEGAASDWQVKVTSFIHTKENILASVMLSEAQKRDQINELRDRGFTQDEKMKMAWQSLQ